MKTSLRLALLSISIILLVACKNEQTNNRPIVLIEETEPEQDSMILSFAFVGCNRIDRHDEYNEKATDASTANLAVLDRIFEDIDQLEKTPSLFFFLGDLVLGESNTTKLNTQLAGWQQLYQDSLKNKQMELVAVPGNHEMLYYEASDGNEYPLRGATDIWLKYMAQYMPSQRNTAPSTSSMDNRLSFSFVRDNIGFIVMNTDTYNPPSADHKFGEESLVPTDWIKEELARFGDDTNIEHIFVLGHKPNYISSTKIAEGHLGIQDGPEIWSAMENTHAHAMLSAHVHEYDRFQVADKGTQVIAGNGGSKLPKQFGYSIIQVMKSGKVKLESRAYDVPSPYYEKNNAPFQVIDSAQLNWTLANVKQ